MRILVHSPFPPLEHHLAGGAQRSLDGLLSALRRARVDVTVVCPSRPGTPLRPGDGRLRIVAQLRTVDQDATPDGLHHDLRLLARYSAEAQVVISVDRPFPLRTATPVVLWLNNFSYGAEARSPFALGWDAIVVPSEYLHRCLRWYFGDGSWTGPPRPIHVIPCGVSPPRVDDHRRRRLRAALGIQAGSRCLAFPHRADPNKGFGTAVRAVREVRRRGHRFVLLVPTPQPGELWPHERPHLGHRVSYARRLGVADAVHFHRWIRAGEMATYLSLAEWSLCLSELPEGFGLSMLESLAAGVPVVATPAGAMREVVPPAHGVRFVPFGDAEGVARALVEPVPSADLARGRSYVRSVYDWDAVAARWVEVLGSVQKADGSYLPAEPGPGLATPWTTTLPGGRVWHDYQRRYVG